MFNQSIHSLALKLADKEFSSVELTNYFLKRIKAYDNTLNSFISVNETLALSQAKAADLLIKQGNYHPLTGIPIAYKDNFCTQGIKTSCGSKMLKNFIAPYTATTINKLNQAGMVMLGKTNMDEFAMGSSNETSYYGAVKNPWNLKKVPGGSSGGSAAAVAAQLTPCAIGSDTGGSIRQPAAFCGLTGLKPTYGRVSRFGMVAFASSLDQAGPMAQSAQDVALLLQTMSGYDANDATSINLPVPDYLQNLENNIKGKRIGLAKEFFDTHLNDDIAKQVLQFANTLKGLGAELIDISLPNMHQAIPCYYIIAPAECSSNLARFDGIRFGYRDENATTLEAHYKQTRAEGFGTEVKRRILVGTYVLSAGYFDAYYLKAQKVRRLIKQDFENAFKTVDVILGPTTPTTAFDLNLKNQLQSDKYLADIYTTAINLAGLPALSLPVGQIDGLPVGAQLIGKLFDEASILNIAHIYQKESQHHLLTPTLFNE